ncbi:MAG: HEAT repeat domain-containing protein [Haloarculaceae archaeon]
MDAALPVRVVEIEPGTVHREPRRSRHVRVRLPDGPTVRVYDPRSVVTPDAVGTERTLELAAVVATVEAAPGAETGLDVAEGSVPEFRGLVVAFDAAGEEAVLDVGAGTVRFDTVTVDRRVHVGDVVRLRRPVVHVESMTPAGQPYDGFLGQLEAADAADRRVAARYLGFRGSERAVGPLVERFRAERSPAVREAIVTALGRLAITARRPAAAPNPRVRSTLEAATGDEAERVRVVADEWVERVSTHWSR